MQKTQRFVADQRFDLPHYNAMIGFISEEFNNYNRAFFSTVNKVVKGWKIIDAGGLDVRVDVASSSLLMNSERTGFEAINFRATTDPLLEITLDDNATNFVEVEIAEGLTGNQSVAIWDPTANSGQGEEFIQSVDTVTCQEPKLVSNTVSFSVSRPDRIPLAIVTTASGAIVDISDQRDFFFHLSSDFNFDGTAFGVTRTDKVIGTMKDDSDALKTIIKEMKGTANWYDPEGTTPLHILERMNYLLTGGGTIGFDLPKPAKGSMIAHKADPTTGIKDGDTFTISDGTTALTFEFDTDGSSPPNAVTFPEESDAATVKSAIISAINTASFDISASSATGNRIELSNDGNGTVGNVAMTETLSNGATLGLSGMDGGFDSNSLSWSGALKIVAPSRSYAYTIDAATISVGEGEVAYVTLPDVGTTPSGSLPVSIIDAASYPLDTSNTRNYIFVYRENSKIYFGNGWQIVELEDGERNQLGDGITEEWVTATGLVDETDDTPPYTSNHWVTPETSFTQAISELDAVVETIYNMVIGTQYDEFLVSDGSASFSAGSFITLPAPFGAGSPQTYQTGLRQIEVYFNGRKMNQGEEWDEVANIGAGVGNQIVTNIDLPDQTKIQFRIQTGGGQDGTVSTAAPDILDEGSLVVSQIKTLNFVGGGVVATSPAPNEAVITVRYPREIAKLCKNDTGTAIPANRAVAWLDDGTVALADANIVNLSDLVGVTAEEIPDGQFGQVIKVGGVPNAVVSLGATNGQEVFLGENPGEITLTPPAGLSDTIICLGRAEPPDGVASPPTDLFLNMHVVAAP